MSLSSHRLQLEWVYGYRGHQCRNNLHYNRNGHLVYFVAAVGIVHDSKNGEQKFYLEHTDDILCLSLNSEKVLAATGQIGDNPFICIWDTTTLKTVSLLKDPGHSGGIAIVSFSHDLHLFLSVGSDEKSTLNIWDIKRAKVIATTSQSTEKVFDAQFHPSWSTEKGTNFVTVVTCGLKSICFWQVCGNVVTSKDGNFGPDSDVQTILCLAFASNGVTFAGTLSGSILLWQEHELQGEIEDAHEGGVFAICNSADGYVTGGRDGKVRLWDSKFKSISIIDLSSSTHKVDWIKSICMSNENQVLIGTQTSEIFEISLRDREKPRCIVSGHAEGELWALATHPRKQIFATGGDDKTLRFWDNGDHKLIHLTHSDERLRSVDFSPDGSLVAAGSVDGSVTILKTKDLSEVAKFKDRKRPVHELKFSPNGDYLFVGCNDGGNDMYHVPQRFKKVFSHQATNSHVTHLDWSSDGKYIQLNNGNKRVSLSPQERKSITWHTWTCTVGPDVAGIWPTYRKTDEINAVDVNFEKKILACGDDFGLVKLFEFPPKPAARAQKYTGHSAHVTNVRWSDDKETLITIGGADHSVFQWRLVSTDKISVSDYHVKDDSDSAEDSGLDIDSDIEKENLNKGYERTLSKPKVSKAMRELMRKELNENGKKRAGPPEANLTLTCAFGYRGYDCHNNVFFTQKGELVFHIAALGIVLDRSNGQQRFYIGHTDDILCLSIHPQKDFVATGEVGKSPMIHIWDVETLKPLSILKGHHTAGVCGLDFSGDGRRLVSVGLDQYHTIVVWEWKRGEKLAETRGHKDKIFGIRFDPTDHTKLAVAGVKLMKFFHHTGGGFTSTRGVFGNVGKMQTMLCLEYGKETGVCFSGAATGSIYCWKDCKLQKVVSTNKGPCFALFPLDMGFVCGGKDGTVSLWDEKFSKCLKTYTISKNEMTDGGLLLDDRPAVRAVALGHGKVAVGTKNGQILEIDKNGAIRMIVQGHKEGEVWGLAVHPIEQKCATASDDGVLRVWNFSHGNQKCVGVSNLKKPARSVAYSYDGKLLALGFKDGSVKVFKVEDFTEKFGFQHRKEEISDVRFSPDPGRYLAVGSHDNFVDIYDIEHGKRVGLCKGSSSYITHLDWDISGTFLQTNSGAREHLFFQAPQGIRQVFDHATAEVDIQWASWTGVLGDTCIGIWPPSSDVTDVNATCLHPNKRLLATADDFGFSKYAKSKTYIGHSAHVTNVRWSCDGKTLLSLGGADTALLCWTLNGNSALGWQSDTSDTDSEEEGFDSDVDQEKNIDYTSKVYSKPLRERLEGTPQELDQGVARKDRKSGVSRKVTEEIPVIRADPVKLAGTGRKGRKIVADVHGLKLDYIFGYRGFDCGNNVHYISDGTEIVFHAAGAGIILNLATGSQRFYLDHSDDILCLTVNQNPRFNSVIATSQIDAEKPIIHVWDSKTLKTISVMRTEHEKGVNCLAFSPSGKYLLSVGLDKDHTLSMWKWNDGTLVASTQGYSNKICDAKFRPDSDNDFVTVGLKHVKFWQLCGSDIVSKRGVLKGEDIPSKMKTMLSIAFAPNKVTYTGCVSGDVYVWKGENLDRIIKSAHQGPIFSMYTTLDDGLIVTGAKEKRSMQSACVKLWDQQMTRSRPMALSSISDSNYHVVKSVSRHKVLNQLLVSSNNMYM